MSGAERADFPINRDDVTGECAKIAEDYADECKKLYDATDDWQGRIAHNTRRAAAMEIARRIRGG
jgi:hypothetical protein